MPKLVKLLRERDPGFVLMFDTRYPWRLPKPGLYADYRAFARECIKLDNVHALAEHTLLSSNVYRSEFFDAKFGEENITTWFPHMFGFLRPLLKNNLSVLIPDFPRHQHARKRAQRAKRWQMGRSRPMLADVSDLLRDEMQMPELDPTSASRAARKAMLANMKAHPVLYLQRYWRALFQPSAYRFLWSRFFGVGK